MLSRLWCFDDLSLTIHFYNELFFDGNESSVNRFIPCIIKEEVWFLLWQRSHILWEAGVCSLHLQLKFNQSSLQQIGALSERNPKQRIACSIGTRSGLRGGLCLRGTASRWRSQLSWSEKHLQRWEREEKWKCAARRRWLMSAADLND